MCSEWGIQNLSRSFTLTYAVSYFDVLKTSLCDKTTLKIMEFFDMQAKNFIFSFKSFPPLRGGAAGGGVKCKILTAGHVTA